jgi:hypothetical protein
MPKTNSEGSVEIGSSHEDPAMMRAIAACWIVIVGVGG